MLTGIGNDGKTLNGMFTVTALIDAIQAVDGVLNSVVPTDIQAKETGASVYVDVLAADGQKYRPIAGYIVEDSGTPLSSTLTYNVI